MTQQQSGTTTKSFIPLQNLDFNAYKNSLKEFLRSQDQFKDYDFDGSNISVLLDILTHNTHFNAFYLNMIGSEMFLDTAQLRDTVVSHAKELNYTPRSRSSAVAYVNIRVVPNGTPSTITIPKYYQIAGAGPEGGRFTFLTNEQIILTSSTNYTAFNVPIFEGSIIREAFEARRNSRFVLQNATIDATSIEVEVQNSRSDPLRVPWTRATALFGLAQTSRVFFVQAADSGRYELSFGNGIVGEALGFGNVVRATYRITAGPDANGVRVFSRAQNIESYTNVQFETVSQAGGGANEESLEDIRFSAPRYFATQERAVTAADFVTLVRTQFPFIQAVNVFGGEEATPKRYGKVLIAAKPRDADFLSDLQRREVEAFVRARSTLSIDPLVVGPEYLYLVIDSQVKYDPSETTSGVNGIEASVRQAIIKFNETTLASFGADLRRSRLVAAIDSADASIVSNQTKTLLSRRIRILPNVTYSGEQHFGQALHRDNGTEPTVYSSSFIYSALNTQLSANFIDDGNGTLQIVDSKTRIVLKANAGRVDYDTGIVTIDAFKLDRLDGGSIFKLYAETLADDIETNNNVILLIESEDVSIRAIGVRV